MTHVLFSYIQCLLTKWGKNYRKKTIYSEKKNNFSKIKGSFFCEDRWKIRPRAIIMSSRGFVYFLYSNRCPIWRRRYAHDHFCKENFEYLHDVMVDVSIISTYIYTLYKQKKFDFATGVVERKKTFQFNFSDF